MHLTWPVGQTTFSARRFVVLGHAGRGIHHIDRNGICIYCHSDGFNIDMRVGEFQSPVRATLHNHITTILLSHLFSTDMPLVQ